MREVLLLFFAVTFAQAEWQRKKKAFWLAGSIINAANILRNNLVIALFGDGG
jgi:exosortase/archaeosortase family protein